MNILLLLLTVVSIPHANCCYTSIIGFGDSLADTGNEYIYALDHHKGPYHFFPPYGETYFHHPTGRCCDGRLIIDLIAESMGLPLVRPYLEVLNVNETVRNLEEGVNFAVVGATALDTDFLDPMGRYDIFTNFSLRIQVDWFKGMLSPLCNTSSECRNLLSSSLIVMGPIGGNDYSCAFVAGDSYEIVETYVLFVIEAMASAINELIQHGASTLLVPGNVPIGCIPAYLTLYEGSDESEYDPSTGCLTWLNKFSEYHNELLKTKLTQIRSLHLMSTSFTEMFTMLSYNCISLQNNLDLQRILPEHAVEEEGHTITTYQHYVVFQEQVLVQTLQSLSTGTVGTLLKQQTSG